MFVCVHKPHVCLCGRLLALKKVSDKYDRDIDFQAFGMATALYSANCNALLQPLQCIMVHMVDKDLQGCERGCER